MPLTADQRKRLKLEYMLTPSVRALAREFGCDEGTIRRAARHLGLRRPRKADPDERGHVIRTKFPTTPDVAALAKELGITEGSLRQHAYRLGVHRAEEIKAQARMRGGLASGKVRRQRKQEAERGPAALEKRVRATPLDAAWRGLLQKST